LLHPMAGLAGPLAAGVSGRNVDSVDNVDIPAEASEELRCETGKLSKRDDRGATSSSLDVPRKEPCRVGSVDGLDSGFDGRFETGGLSPKGGLKVDTTSLSHDLW
jgi:hypothetical protein